MVTSVDPTDREQLRTNLERFAGRERVTERYDGTLVAEFSGSTHFAVDADDHVTSGMPLHGFDGPAERLRFDHENGELHVEASEGRVSYTFRRT